MKVKYVDVHFDDGCAVGALLSVNECVATVMLDDDVIYQDIPLERISDWYEYQTHN